MKPTLNNNVLKRATPFHKLFLNKSSYTTLKKFDNILQIQETSNEELIKILTEKNFISSLSKQQVLDIAKLCSNVYEEKQVELGDIVLEQISKLKETILKGRKNENVFEKLTGIFTTKTHHEQFIENLTHDMNVLEHEITILKNNSVRNMVELLKENETFMSYRVLGYSLRNDDQLSSIFLYNQLKNHMVIVFKGTQSIQDWSININMGIKESSLVFGKPKFKLHDGFQHTFLDRIDDFDATFDQILHLYKQEMEKSKLSVTVTGHSLGGALSMIAAYYIKKKHHKIISTVNNVSFASPKVFTKTSSMMIEQFLGKSNILRIWNQLDPIAVLPKSGNENKIQISYKHVGYDIMYKDNEFVNPHSMARYIELTQEKYPNLESLQNETIGIHKSINCIKT